MKEILVKVSLILIVGSLAACGPREDPKPKPNPGTNKPATPASSTTAKKVATNRVGAGCDADVADFCGGWTVTNTTIPHQDEHMDLNDRFLIDKQGANLWLFPRPNLNTRWKNFGKVKLNKIEDGGAVECMAGKVRINPVHVVDNTPSWHRLTIRTTLIDTETELGEVTGLLICVDPQASGAEPTSCQALPCPPPDLADPRNHGGRVHAEN